MMGKASFCIIHTKGHYDDYHVVSVSGKYVKADADKIVSEFNRPATDDGYWEHKEVVKFIDETGD